MLRAITGSLGLRPMVADGSDIFNWFDQEMRTRGNDSRFPSVDVERGVANNYWCAYAFDSALALGLGLKNVLDQGLDPRVNRSELYDAIITQSFNGTTGLVMMDSNGDRMAGYDVVNVLANGSYVNVGTVFNGTFSKNQNLVIWPGGRTSVPDDGFHEVIVEETTNIFMLLTMALSLFVVICTFMIIMSIIDSASRLSHDIPSVE